MNIIDIAFYTIKRILKDKRSNIIKIVAPLVAIFILGAALKGGFELSSMKIIEVGYINNDAGEAGDSVIKMLKDTESINKLIHLKEIPSIEEGEDMVIDDKICSFLVIEDNFSDLLQKGERNNIKIYSGEYSDYKLTVVQNIMDSYANIYNTSISTMKVTGTPAEFDTSEVVKTNSIDINGKKPRAIDYYAVTILVLTLFSGAAYGCELVGEDYIGVMGRRIKSTPVKATHQYIGKMFGACLANFIQGLVMVLFTKFVMKVNWGASILPIIGYTFLVAMFATGIGAMFCIIFKDINRAAALTNLLVPICTFIAGGYIKIDFGPLKNLSPSQWAHTAFFNTIYDGDQQLVTVSVLMLLGGTLITAIISIFTARRRSN